MKRRRQKQWKQFVPLLFERVTSPTYLLLILIVSLGFSKVGQAATRLRKTLKQKRQNFKEAAAHRLAAKAWEYFRPAWREQENNRLPAPIPALDTILDDSQGRIEREFRIPRSLRGRVAFWMEVYARFDSRFRIVHDKDRPEIIYGYLDFRSLYRALPRRMAHRRALQMEELVLKELKQRIAEAVDLVPPSDYPLSGEERLAVQNHLVRLGIGNTQEAASRLRRIRAQTGQKDNFLAGIHRSEKYLPQIEQIFREKGLPVRLARLPFVESSFNPHAVSKVGALGMWQFLPDTAKRFAPRHTRREWADPILQSRSAARMFEILYGQVNNWGLAITGYNSGILRVKRIAEQYRVSDVEDLVQVPLAKGNLGFAGSNFYCEFLAASYIEAYKDQAFGPEAIEKDRRARVRRQIQSVANALLQTSESKPSQEAPKPPSHHKVQKPKRKIARQVRRPKSKRIQARMAKQWQARRTSQKRRA